MCYINTINYLDIEVQQSTTEITINQSACAKKLLDTNEGPTPVKKGWHIGAVDATNYRSIVGSLHYLVNTRPGLAYYVGYVSRFTEPPREEHIVAVKRILRYVARTRGWGVRFCAGEKMRSLSWLATVIVT